jgi:adenylosuccinate synthase
MASIAVIGTQWGDEGKGKVVDLLAEKVDIIARFQGGPNAGHTVVVRGEKYILHSVPTGILYPHKRCIVGGGMVIDPASLLQEVEELQARGVIVDTNLIISRKAHLILPYHRVLDQAREQHLGEGKIGTTGRGIGPAYMDKVARTGIRVGDLWDEPLFRAKLQQNLEEKNGLFLHLYGRQPLDAEAIYREYMAYRERLHPYVADAEFFLKEAILKGQHILLEGAQGTMLDVDHGSYPFVTSSNAIVGGASTGVGIPPSKITTVIGVTKAYTTRVGEGPFPTELTDTDGELLRNRGKEYGATTGRPRRCGWFDAVVVRHAVWLNGIAKLALTKLDVLDHCPRVFLCTAYRYRGSIVHEVPEDLSVFCQCQPIYEELEGWQQNTHGLTRFADLPDQAKRYIDAISRCVGVEMALISTGFARDHSILLQSLF